MCVQDIAISRRVKVVPRSQTTGADATLRFQPNGNRLAVLIVLQPGTAQAFVTYDVLGSPVNVLVSQGSWDNTDSAFVWTNSFHINYRDHPGLITGAFNIVTPAAGTYSWVELWVDDALSGAADRAIS